MSHIRPPFRRLRRRDKCGTYLYKIERVLGIVIANGTLAIVKMTRAEKGKLGNSRLK